MLAGLSIVDNNLFRDLRTPASWLSSALLLRPNLNMMKQVTFGCQPQKNFSQNNQRAFAQSQCLLPPIAISPAHALGFWASIKS